MLARLLRESENETPLIISTGQGARSQNPSRQEVREQDGGAHNPDQQDSDIMHTSQVELVRLVTSLSESVTNLRKEVKSLDNKLKSRPHCNEQTVTEEHGQSVPNSNTNEVGDFTLSTAYSAFQSFSDRGPSAAAGSEAQMVAQSSSDTPGSNPAYVKTAFGYAAQTLPLVETVSPGLRTRIIQGRDVNVASLLIPYYDVGSSDKSTKADPRLNKCLTIGEFIHAFGVYKHVMCRAFPRRRTELDLYEREIVSMASRYPGSGFYDYHRQFSLQAAANLRYNNICTDWSVRDNNLYSTIFTNVQANLCDVCSSALHASGFCPQLLVHPSQPPQHSMVVHTQPQRQSAKPTHRGDSSIDTHGRLRMFHDNQEICNNFNGDRGCFVQACRKVHICLACRRNHSRPNCPLGKGPPVHKKS